jgi:hypothetical protein
MFFQAEIKPGMTVVSADGTTIGVVQSVGIGSFTLVRETAPPLTLPLGTIADIILSRVLLNVAADQV